MRAARNNGLMLNAFGDLFAYCVVISYNIITPFLVQESFEYTPDQYGYLAICIGLPYYIAASFNRTIVMKKSIYFSCILGCVLVICSGVVMLFTNIAGYQTLFALMIPFLVATFGQALIFSNTLASALQLFPAYSGGRMSALFTVANTSLELLRSQNPDSNSGICKRMKNSNWKNRTTVNESFTTGSEFLEVPFRPD